MYLLDLLLAEIFRFKLFDVFSARVSHTVIILVMPQSSALEDSDMAERSHTSTDT